MKKITIISLAALALSIQSCRKDYLYVAPPAPAITTTVHFATEVYPLFTTSTAKCGNCHDASGSTLDFSVDAPTAYTSLIAGNYVIPNNAAASQLYVSITTGVTNGIMPKPVTSTVFTPTELETIKAWINQGALNN